MFDAVAPVARTICGGNGCKCIKRHPIGAIADGVQCELESRAIELDGFCTERPRIKA